MFNPNYSLFVASGGEGGTTFQPNPLSEAVYGLDGPLGARAWFQFVGRILGKAVADGCLIDAHFTRSFYKHLLGAPLSYEDIEAVDPDYHKNLRWMLEHDIAGVLDLTFAEETDFFGRRQVAELVPGGAAIKVTDANKRVYVDLVARHRMTNAIRPQIDAFLRGFWDVVPRHLAALFNDHELELMIAGLPEIDVADMRAHAEYHGGYSAASAPVRWFWEVAAELDRQDLALLVQFITGTSKVPLEGFGALAGVHGPQRLQVHRAYGPTDRLPQAHTCFNQLDLPEYESREQLRERLLVAIREGAEGFAFA
jgi:E3 ubiquitin-protein ligase HUWE1